MKRISKNKFNRILEQAIEQAATDKYLRIGQCLFNIFHAKFPAQANKIRGGRNDPFFSTSLDDDRVKNFIKTFRENVSGQNKTNSTYEKRISNLLQVIQIRDKTIEDRNKWIHQSRTLISDLKKSDRITKEELKKYFKKKNTI